MDIKTILIIMISLLIIMPVVYIILERIDRKDKARQNFGAKLYLNKAKNIPFYSLYRYLCGIPVISNYIQKISRRYELVCPGNPKSIADKTMALAGVSFLLCILEVILVFGLEPGIKQLILAIYLIYVINMEVINHFINTAELKLLEELERFVSNVGHNYFNRYYIDDAVMDAVDNRMSEEMKTNAKMLYSIITSKTLKEDVARYNSTTHNKYLKMLLILCISVMENGDKKVGGQRLMTINLINLKREINLEYLKQKQLRFIFSGSIFAAVVVCLPLTLIQNFGISIAPELESAYLGQIGILYVGLIFLSSAIVYLMINNAKEIKRSIPKNYLLLQRLESIPAIRKSLDNFIDKFYGVYLRIRDILKRLGETITPRQLLLKSLLTSLITFLACILLVFYIHDNNRKLVTGKVTDTVHLTRIGNEEELKIINAIILDKVNRHKGDSITTGQILTELQADDEIYQEALLEETAIEITERIRRYREEYFKWYELFLCIGISTAAFLLPFLMLLYRKRLLKGDMEDEVIQFNSIIYMMMYTDHVTVIDILEQMELFAVVFKPAIRECINEYNSGDNEALQKMRERECYEPFLRLVDSLIRCDDITIENAFDEIASDRENFYERRKLENTQTIQRRADNIKPLAYVPGILVLIYLIVPLLYISMKGLADLTGMLQGMGI